MDYKFAMYDNVCEECFRIVFYGRGYTPEYVDELSPSERKQILDYIEGVSQAQWEAMFEWNYSTKLS